MLYLPLHLFVQSPKRDTSFTVDPPTEAEISEYGRWLGLGEDDIDLLWIAKQALQTAIPVPWIECQTDDGDVFYYNAKTKESVWDHPYDSYYKSVIGRFKSGECSKEELVALVSQDWLIDGDDLRASSTENPSILPDGVTGSSPSTRRRSRPSLDNSAESPKITIKLTNEHLSILTGEELLHAPAGMASPVRNRRRSGSGAESFKHTSKVQGSKLINAPTKSETSGTDHTSDVSSIEGELQRVKDALKTNALELEVAKLKVEELTRDIRTIEADHQKRVTALTADLIKAREFIELLLGDNNTLRVKMKEALSRVVSLQKESGVGEDANRREFSESQLLFSLDEDSRSGARKANILGRLCGSTASSTNKQKPRIRRVEAKSAPVTPTAKSLDPYKELMQLLETSASVPLTLPRKSPSRIQ